MKTIFITSFHPVISRNILSTDIMRFLLQDKDIKVVLIVPAYKKTYFESTFGSERVAVEGVETGAQVRNWASLLLKHLNRNALDTDTVRIKAEAAMRLDGKVLYYYLFFWPVALLSRLRWFRRSLRVLNYLLRPRHRFTQLFEIYRPDVIFSTDVQIDADVLLMYEAQEQGVRIASKVRSWDNLSQWGLLRVIPSMLMVPTEEVKREALAYHDVPEDRIVIVGVPHYDRYLEPPTQSRETFLKHHGLDPASKLILYAPIADFRIRNNDADEYILSIVARLKASVWVRFPPNNEVSLRGFKPPAHMFFDKPGVAYDPKRLIDRDISPEEDALYHNLLHHVDIVVAGPSTVAIDAAVCDKPVVLVNFAKTMRDFWHGITEYRYTHIQHLVASGGVRVALSREMLLHQITAYLSDPKLDSEGRHRLVREQCYQLDGHASERVARTLIDVLSS